MAPPSSETQVKQQRLCVFAGTRGLEVDEPPDKPDLWIFYLHSIAFYAFPTVYNHLLCISHKCMGTAIAILTPGTQRLVLCGHVPRVFFYPCSSVFSGAWTCSVILSALCVCFCFSGCFVLLQIRIFQSYVCLSLHGFTCVCACLCNIHSLVEPLSTHSDRRDGRLSKTNNPPQHGVLTLLLA